MFSEKIFYNKKHLYILVFVLFYFWGLSAATIESDTAISQSKTVQLNSVTVSSKLKDANIKSGSTGISIDIDDIKLLPKIIGDADPFKALQYISGVSQTGEAKSGLFVRGGNNDQNLILFNGIQIQNPTHILGLFSSFNPELTEQITFIKAGIPAEYGGCLSSVLDISTSLNIPEKFTLDGSIGLISSRFTIKVPIAKKISFYAAARSSYINLIIMPFLEKIGIDKDITSNKYGFYDINAGFNYKVNSKNIVSGHFYFNTDYLKMVNIRNLYLGNSKMQWSNLGFSLQHTSAFSDSFLFHQQFSLSNFNMDLKWADLLIGTTSKYNSTVYKADFTNLYRLHNFKYGVECSYNMSFPNFLEAAAVSNVQGSSEYNSIYSAFTSLFFRDEINFKKLQINVGIRANVYFHLGDYTDYREGNNNVYYKKGKIVKPYFGVEPRLFIRYLLNNVSSVKFSASRNIQFLNQIPTINFGIPADFQMPASLYVKPQASWHFSGGYFHNFKNNMWETSVEAYYKNMENQLEMPNGDFMEIFTKNVEQTVLSGKGYAYGLELSVKKTEGKITGWLSYNLSWTWRQFREINNGKPFLANNDRRHNASLVLMYKLNEHWDFSAVFVYATGSKMNLPLSWYVLGEKLMLEYGDYNAFELPAYHRLDLSVNYKFKSFRRFSSELNLSVYNVYNRKNPFQVYYNTTDGFGMSYLLPIIPYLSYTFHF